MRVDSDGRPSATQITEGADQQGSAAQELDVVELACQRHGSPCRVPRSLDLARAVPDVSQGKEQLGLPAGVGLVGKLHRLQGALVLAGRFLVGDGVGGVHRGPGRVVHGLVDGATSRRFSIVVGELAEVGHEVGLVHGLDGFTHPLVQPNAANGRELVIERLAHQVVGEVEAVGTTFVLDDEAGSNAPFQGVEQLVR